MKTSPQILRTPLQITARLRLAPECEIRWPASKPITGYLVIRGDNPYDPGHPYGDYWLGATRGRDPYGRPYSKVNPCYHFTLFNENGEFTNPSFFSNEGFIVPDPYPTDRQAARKLYSIQERASPGYRSEPDLLKRATRLRSFSEEVSRLEDLLLAREAPLPGDLLKLLRDTREALENYLCSPVTL